MAVTLGYGAPGRFVLLKPTDAVTGVRVTREQERDVLEIVLHGEQVF